MLSSSPAAAQATTASAAQQQQQQQQIGGGVSSSAGSASSSGSVTGAGSSSRSNSSRRESDFKAAWDLLQRSLACFLKDKAAKNGMQLPNAWNPLAWLVVYCAVVKRDSRQDGKLVAASSRADATAAAAAAAAAGGLEGAESAVRDGMLSSSMATLGSAGPSGQLQGGLAAAAGAGGGRGWPGELCKMFLWFCVWVYGHVTAFFVACDLALFWWAQRMYCFALALLACWMECV
jgi:hypothetical protein